MKEMKNKIVKKIINILIAIILILTVGCLVTPIVFQYILCWSKFGIVSSAILIPHWSLLLYIPAIIGMIVAYILCNY